jgi:hypothetical protein
LDQDFNSDDDLVSSFDDEPVWHIKEKAMKNYADYFFYIKYFPMNVFYFSASAIHYSIGLVTATT